MPVSETGEEARGDLAADLIVDKDPIDRHFAQITIDGNAGNACLQDRTHDIGLIAACDKTGGDDDQSVDPFGYEGIDIGGLLDRREIGIAEDDAIAGGKSRILNDPRDLREKRV